MRNGTGNRSVMRVMFCALLVLCAASVSAQPDGLAKDFEKLSAKERARVAKEEQQSALNDVPYQALMTEAENLFQKQQYEASLAKFQEARTMRPYNVYPKVKIQDLQALIARRDAEQAAVADQDPVPTPVEEILPRMANVSIEEPRTPEPEFDPLPSGPALAPAAVSPIASAPVTARPPERIGTPVQKHPEPKVHDPTAVDRSVIGQNEPEEPLEVGERVYKEGRSIVVEQRIAENGRVVVYRKVTHPWGGIDHFRDGQPVTGRVYEQALGNR